MKEAMKTVKERIHSFFEEDRTAAPPAMPDAAASMADSHNTEPPDNIEHNGSAVVMDEPNEVEESESAEIFPDIESAEDEGISEAVNPDLIGRMDDIAAELAALAAVTADLDQRIVAIKETVSESNAQAETLRMMSSRVKAYEEEFVSTSILRPIMKDFIHLHDSVTKACQWFSQSDEDKDWRESAADALDGIQSELCDTMHRHGLSPMQDTGDLLDPSIHKVVGVIRKEAVRDGEIAELVRIGWLWNGHVARHAEVKVNRYITNREV